MNVLVITPFYYIEGRPDLLHDTNVVHYFAKYWAENNKVFVLNVYPNSYKDISRYLKADARKNYKNGYRFCKDNVEVKLIEVQKMPGQKGHYFGFQSKHIVKQAVDFVKSNDLFPDVIVVHVPSYADSFLESLKKKIRSDVPVIGVLHYTDIEELKYRKKLCESLEKQYKFLYARSHGILRLAKNYSLCNLKNDIIQSGIPTKLSETLRAPINIENGLRIIYVGKLIPRKNVDKIILAIHEIHQEKQNENISLEIVGVGSEEVNLKKLVEKCGLTEMVKFCGSLTRENVIKKMANANMFCMPSVNETLGLTYIESMSVGCIPIGTKDEGIDGVINNEKNGYLVNRDNFINELKKIFYSYCAMDDMERLQLSNNAYETARQLDERDCAIKYLHIIRRSIDIQDGEE